MNEQTFGHQVVDASRQAYIAILWMDEIRENKLALHHRWLVLFLEDHQNGWFPFGFRFEASPKRVPAKADSLTCYEVDFFATNLSATLFPRFSLSAERNFFLAGVMFYNEHIGCVKGAPKVFLFPLNKPRKGHPQKQTHPHTPTHTRMHTHTHPYCGWTKSCTIMKPWLKSLFVGIYVEASSLPFGFCTVVRNGFRNHPQ